MKVLTVVGARPQFVKAAVVSRQLGQAGVEEFLLHTGQHYDERMSAVFFDEMAIPRPDRNLEIGPGRHGEQTGRMLAGIEGVLLAERPDRVLVYGDTNSTLAGALAAAKLHVPVAHVEAGLRSFNRRMPEELNRILTDDLSDLLFAPTTTAVANLRREGVPDDHIVRTGDVMYDAVLFYTEAAESRSHVLTDLGLEPGGYVLATVHRAENTDDPARLKAVMTGLAALARRLPVVLPLHPRTDQALAAAGIDRAALGLRFVDPVGYFDMLLLERHARLIATDSGGVQKEAFFHGVPCATLREETEWTELVAAGANRLVPPTGGDADAVGAGLVAALDEMERLERPEPLYGTGDAGGRIVTALVDRGGRSESGS